MNFHLGVGGCVGGCKTGFTYCITTIKNHQAHKYLSLTFMAMLIAHTIKSLMALRTGCIYIVGSYVWSSLTAIYRIIYLKCQFLVRGGERWLLRGMLLVGSLLHLIATLWLAILDPSSSSEKMCRHHSSNEVLIIQAYEVKTAF